MRRSQLLCACTRETCILNGLNGLDGLNSLSGLARVLGIKSMIEIWTATKFKKMSFLDRRESCWPR